jgi:adenylylsulfate kinase
MKSKKVIEEKPRRSIVKAITYRAIIMCSDGLIIFFLTHRYDLALGVILFSNLASTILYIAHERFWSRINWGRVASST